MADPGQQGFEVVPTRIGGTAGGGRPNRRRRLPIAIVVAFAVGIPAIAWIGPKLESRPEVDLSFLRPTPTPFPSITPRPVDGRPPNAATPLPDLTVAAGEHPTEPFAIDVNGVRLVDPTTGELGPDMDLRIDTDAVFTSADGDGWWCVCFDRVQGSGSETTTVEIHRVDGAGQTTERQAVGEYVSTASPPGSDFYTRFDLEIAPDGRTGYLASAARTGDDWAIAVETIDLETGVVSGRVDLGSLSVAPLPGPTAPPDQGLYENYMAGPLMRLSPDGRRLLVWAWVDVYSSTGEPGPPISKVWTIGLDERGGGPVAGGLVPFPEVAANRLRQCPWVTWTTPDELAAVCWPGDPVATFNAVILRADGSEVRRSEIPWAMDSWFAEPILDLANRALYLWQPNAHLLQRVELDTGRTDRLEVEPDATAGGIAGSSPGPGGATLRKPAVWATFGSDLRLYNNLQIIPERGGSRLFALGMLTGDQGYGGPEFASTGIWVFDGREFALVDRWAAATGYSSLGLSDDGRWLMATGMPGADADGNPASWEASLTIHDTIDGRPALQLGSLGSDTQIFLMPR
jgi:hypothetical protein